MTARAKAILAIALLFISGRDAVTADLDRGRRIFQTCASCHVLDRDRSTFGPYLKGVFGRRIGSLPDYNYSPAMKVAGADGKSWDEQTLGEFLYSPAKAIPGTKMRFWGLWNSDIEDLVAFLKVQH
ncbi:cytochrome c family protein [Rhizobium sp. BK251]|uniref:c-type cytochrome n=1 Tax=Rhizobium sp. BK251 TaxID=2512125 RepID=UPI0010503B4C|nr:cytochrome c family protein [Rhizobium sp. BK251]TCL73985.1 cytochrome c [Rhizobium sp. BK251]